jgi:hypothetical protein
MTKRGRQVPVPVTRKNLKPLFLPEMMLKDAAAKDAAVKEMETLEREIITCLIVKEILQEKETILIELIEAVTAETVMSTAAEETEKGREREEWEEWIVKETVKAGEAKETVEMGEMEKVILLRIAQKEMEKEVRTKTIVLVPEKAKTVEKEKTGERGKDEEGKKEGKVIDTAKRETTRRFPPKTIRNRIMESLNCILEVEKAPAEILRRRINRSLRTSSTLQR